MAGKTLSEPIPWDEIAVFKRLNPEDREILRPLTILREYERNEHVFEQGQPSDTIYWIVTGRIKMVKMRPDGHELIIEILGAGDPMGVVAALEGFDFPATSIVHEKCRVLSISRRDFLAFLETHPSLVRGILAGLCYRNLQLTARLADFPGTVEARLSRLFQTLAKNVGEHKGSGVEIHLALTRQEIADLVGTTLETAIRILSRWGKEGLVLTHKDGFTIADLSTLERLVEGN